MSMDSGGYRGQAQAASAGGDQGPAIGGDSKGPTDRRDVIIAVVAIALVVAVILLLVL